MSRNVAITPRRLESYEEGFHGSRQFALSRRVSFANEIMAKVFLNPYGNDEELPEGVGDGPKAKIFVYALTRSFRTRVELIQGKKTLAQLQEDFEQMVSALREFRSSTECSYEAFSATEGFLQVASYALELFYREVSSVSPLQRLIEERDESFLRALTAAAPNSERLTLGLLFGLNFQEAQDRQLVLDFMNLRDDFIEGPTEENLIPYLKAQRALYASVRTKEELEPLDEFEATLLVEVLWLKTKEGNLV